MLVTGRNGREGSLTINARMGKLGAPESWIEMGDWIVESLGWAILPGQRQSSMIN